MKYLVANILDFTNQSFLLLSLTEEQKKRAKIKSTLVSYCLLDMLLKEYHLGVKDIYYENGKPMIIGLYISVTHKDNYVACIVSDKAVGIDIEKIKIFDKKVLEYFFTKEEKEYILSSPNQEEEFFKVFTMKECISKINGLGIKSFPNFSVIKENKLYYSNYEIINKRLNFDYILSICYEK